MDEDKVRFRSKVKVSNKSSEIRRVKRNKSRRLRRKRSKLRFLKQLRFTRITRNLCDGVKVIDITGMSDFPAVIPEVADWQLRHNLAYWKSKAISLEYENKMLLEHIKRFYRAQIAEFVEDEEAELTSECQESEVVEDGGVREIRESFESLSPDTEARAVRKEEMRLKYGEQTAKINGMEVAVQLNYDFQCEKEKPIHWPNIPLNL